MHNILYKLDSTFLSLSLWAKGISKTNHCLNMVKIKQHGMYNIVEFTSDVLTITIKKIKSKWTE